MLQSDLLSYSYTISQVAAGCLRNAKKLEDIEKARTRVNNCKYAKDSSIRATLFKGKVQKCVGKALETVICLNLS